MDSGAHRGAGADKGCSVARNDGRARKPHIRQLQSGKHGMAWSGPARLTACGEGRPFQAWADWAAVASAQPHLSASQEASACSSRPGVRDSEG
jgi:hypothetical protein